MQAAGKHAPTSVAIAPQPAQRLDDRPETPPASGWWAGRSCFACCTSRASTPYQDTLGEPPALVMPASPIVARAVFALGDRMETPEPGAAPQGFASRAFSQARVGPKSTERVAPDSVAPSSSPARTPGPSHSPESAFLTPTAQVSRPHSVGLPGPSGSPAATTPTSTLRPRDVDAKSGESRRSFDDALHGARPSPSGLTPPVRIDPETLLANFGRILASDQPDHEMRRQLLEQVRSAVRSKSMTGEVLQQLCAVVLGSQMPPDSQRYFLSAAFGACRSVLAVDDVVALRKTLSSQGWETIASLQVLANLYVAGTACLNRESALAEWAAAKARHPKELPDVRRWIEEALKTHAPHSAFR